jgi:hypothetical protein
MCLQSVCCGVSFLFFLSTRDLINMERRTRRQHTNDQRQKRLAELRALKESGRTRLETYEAS